MTRLPLPRRWVVSQPKSQTMTVPIALFVGLVLSAAFIGLVAVVLPGVLLMAVAGGGMLVFFALQYFLWAKWLYPIVMKMEAQNQTESNTVADNVAATATETES
ncbi:MAG: hypothetical protein O2856_09495 [Planctomycetota bacterium]|nr:hypothetical protein [Planctomycetota bacterium]